MTHTIVVCVFKMVAVSTLLGQTSAGSCCRDGVRFIEHRSCRATVTLTEEA